VSSRGAWAEVCESLRGAVALITGASSGIGRAYARSLVGAGARVVLVARSHERLEALAGELGGEAAVVAGDVAEPSTGQRAVEAALGSFGRLDAVLPNAGVYLAGELWEADLDAAREVVATNVVGVLSVVRAALPHLVAQGRGDVVVTSSVSGHQAIHWEPVYSATKHAVQALVHGVRRQLVGTGVRMGEVGPGVVLNELWGFGDGRSTAEEVTAGRGILSEDVAEAVLFMLTRPRHVTVRDLVLLPSAQEI
jgi:ribitol 2-dehydrogenase